jgi:hypothetical protein
MTAYDVRELLVRMVMRQHGGPLMRWRTVVGEIRVYPLSTHPHCNWRADPSGTVREVEAAERVIDQVSAQHPIVR